MAYSPNLFGATASANTLGSPYVNGSGSTIPMGTPVSVNSSGQIAPTDPTSPASSEAIVGFALTSIANGVSGQVISTGRLLNLTGYSFTTGMPVYVGIGGVLTQVPPAIGVGGFTAGNTVIFCGVIVNNTLNPSNQDLSILTEIVGVL